jgi:hypothetical protein
MGNCPVQIPRVPSGVVRLGTIFQLLVRCSYSPAEGDQIVRPNRDHEKDIRKS